MESIVIVTTPATDTALTTLDAVHSALGITGTDSDAFLQTLIDQATDILAHACGRSTFGLETITQTFGRQHNYEFLRRYHEHRDQSRVLGLARYPIVELTSITDREGAVDPSEYTLEPGTGLVYRHTCHWYALPVTAVYTAGFDLAVKIPPALNAAALALVQSGWNAVGGNTFVQTETTQNIGQTTYFPRAVAAMSPDAAMLSQLNAFRLCSF